MSEKFYLRPMVSIYRTFDRQTYLLMHLAAVDPGHYVGWGKLGEVPRAEMLVSGRDYVIGSLREFPNRNGRNRAKRLYMKDKPPLHTTYELVRACASTPAELELVPYRRGELQHELADDKKIRCNVDVSAERFFSKLEEAYPRVV